MRLRIVPRWLAAPLVVAFALRALWALTVGAAGDWRAEVFFDPDSLSYLVPAQSLAGDLEFTTYGVPEIVRTPGYPWLLVPGVLIGAPVLFAVAVQVLLSTATVAVAGLLALRLWRRERTAALAAWLLAIDPLSIHLSSRILTECAFTFLSTAAVLLAARIVRAPSWKGAVWCGALLAVGTFVRPAGIALWVPLALAIATAGRRGLFCAAIVAAIAALPPLAWTMRNRSAAGYDRFTGIADINALLYTAAGVTAVREGKSFRDVQVAWGADTEAEYLAAHPEQRDWPLARRLKWMRQEASKRTEGAIVLLAKQHAKGMLRTAGDPGVLDPLKAVGVYPRNAGLLGVAQDRGALGALKTLATDYPQAAAAMALGLAYLGALWFAATVGLLGRRSLRRGTVWAAAMALAYFVLAGGGPAATARFRAPAMPLLAVCAAQGVVVAVSLRRRRCPPADNGTDTIRAASDRVA